MGLWSTKSIAKLQADPTLDGGAPSFHRVLGAGDLSAIGVGAILGAGIFVVTGTASAQFAGPAIVLSFIIAGLGCLFVALCYAELASMMPVAGSAYTYSYAAFGELIAWMVGWVLILEYLFGAGAVAVSWSSYFIAFLGDLGVTVPAALTHGPFAAESGLSWSRTPDGIVNLPAVALVVAFTAVVLLGIRPTAIVNRLIVFVKVAIVLLVVGFGFLYLTPSNWRPFVPENGGSFGRYGWSGVLRGAAAVFFAFIGFDVVSLAAQEARNPDRDVPIGILTSLGVCATLYVLMALVMTGLTRYPDLNAPHPLIAAFSAAGPSMRWLTHLIRVAILSGLASVALMMLLSLSRILVAMARDRLVPRSLARVLPGWGTPVRSTLLAGTAAAIIAGVFPMGVLLEAISLGALLIFAVVCIVVLTLRYREPNVRRPFRVPLVPLVPLLGLAFSVGAMAIVPFDSWIRLIIWSGIGLAMYFLFLLGRPRIARS